MFIKFVSLVYKTSNRWFIEISSNSFRVSDWRFTFFHIKRSRTDLIWAFLNRKFSRSNWYYTNIVYHSRFINVWASLQNYLKTSNQFHSTLNNYIIIQCFGTNRYYYIRVWAYVMLIVHIKLYKFSVFLMSQYQNIRQYT